MPPDGLTFLFVRFPANGGVVLVVVFLCLSETLLVILLLWAIPA
jgi:hypothetical protein